MPQSGTVAAGPRGWSTTQLAWGCIGSFAAGVVALYAVGFHWVGEWQTGRVVQEKLAVAACVQTFLLQPNRGVIYTELKGNPSSYQRRQLIRSHKLTPDRAIEGLCDDQIMALDPGHFEVPETAEADAKQPA